MALLLFLGALVLHHYFATAGYAGIHQDQGAMRVDGQRLGFFLERIALRVLSANADGDLHQHSLAAATHRRCSSRIGGLRHATSLGQLYPAKPDCRATTPE